MTARAERAPPDDALRRSRPLRRTRLAVRPLAPPAGRSVARLRTRGADGLPRWRPPAVHDRRRGARARDLAHLPRDRRHAADRQPVGAAPYLDTLLPRRGGHADLRLRRRARVVRARALACRTTRAADPGNRPPLQPVARCAFRAPSPFS